MKINSSGNRLDLVGSGVQERSDNVEKKSSRVFSSSESHDKKNIRSRETSALDSLDGWAESLRGILCGIDHDRKLDQVEMLNDELYAFLVASIRKKKSGVEEKVLKKRMERLGPGDNNSCLAKTKGEQAYLKKKRKKLQELGRLLLKEDVTDTKVQGILKGYCRPELADYIPDDILAYIQKLLVSEKSPLPKLERGFIRLLSSHSELRKIIANNPHLFDGELHNMDDVVFREGGLDFGSAGKYSDPDEPGFCGLSFQRACFTNNCLRGNARYCDFSNAAFVGTNLFGDFTGSNFSGASLLKVNIFAGKFTNANLHHTQLDEVRFPQWSCTQDAGSFIQAVEDYYKNNKGNAKAVSTMSSMVSSLLSIDGGGKGIELCKKMAELTPEIAEEMVDQLVKNAQEIRCIDKELEKKQKEAFFKQAVDCVMDQVRGIGTKDSHNIASVERMFGTIMLGASEVVPHYDCRLVLENILKSSLKDNFAVNCSIVKMLFDKQNYPEGEERLWRLLDKHDLGKMPELMVRELSKYLSDLAEENTRDHSRLEIAMDALDRLITSGKRLYGPFSLEKIVEEARAAISADASRAAQLKGIRAFSPWIYKIDMLVKSGRIERAYEVALEMDSNLPGSLDLFTGGDDKATAYKAGGCHFDEEIDRASKAFMTLKSSGSVNDDPSRCNRDSLQYWPVAEP